MVRQSAFFSSQASFQRHISFYAGAAVHQYRLIIALVNRILWGCLIFGEEDQTALRMGLAQLWHDIV